MSIIYDALKKAGDDKSLKGSSKRPGVSVERSKSSGGFNGGLLFVIAVLLVGGALILSPLSRAPRRVNQPQAAGFRPNAPAHALASPRVAGQFGIEEIPGSAPFQVTGVVFGNGNPYGIINNQVVSQGQQVSGATVRSITTEQVTLDYNGETIVLPVSDANAI